MARDFRNLGERYWSRWGPHRSSLIVLALVLATLSPSRAQQSDIFAEPRVRASLLSELTTVKPGDHLWLALRFDIDPGWHTYWRNPGDSGEPTRIQWDLPAGVKAGAIQWPYPHRIPYGSLVNFGYEGSVLHLIRLDVPATWEAGNPIPVTANASWLVCADVCIPEAAQLRVEIPTGPTSEANASLSSQFQEARTLIPVDSPWPSYFRLDEQDIVLTLDTGSASDRVSGAVFFPNEWGPIEPAAEQSLHRSPSDLTLRASRGQAVPTGVLEGVIVLTEQADDGAITRAITVSANPDQAAAIPGTTSGATVVGGMGSNVAPVSVAQALAFAFLGGLILNLMPCVFPVLSMKAIGFVRHGHAGGRRLWQGGLAYAAGVLLFMALLAAVLLALRYGGAEIGWGFQLQSPLFVGVMALVLFTLGLVMSGFVSVSGSISGIGSGFTARQGVLGDLGTGALAALVATPCTAPFMGTAIGFALTQPWGVALAVMFALGVGLALPYVLLTLIPGLARLLPKPGVWMERLKQILAFPLYASAVWLVWVLALQAGPAAVAAALSGMLLIGFSVWLWRATADAGTTVWRVAGRVGSLAAVGTALALIVTVQSSGSGVAAPTEPEEVSADERSETFSPERLEALRRDGRAVFVNMTAAWCITCKVNEQVALRTEGVEDAFEDTEVVYLLGDWTNRDPAITRYLQSYGRSGVPLYVLYPVGGGAGKILPQILTEQTLVDAFYQAARLTTVDVGALRAAGEGR